MSATTSTTNSLAAPLANGHSNNASTSQQNSSSYLKWVLPLELYQSTHQIAQPNPATPELRTHQWTVAVRHGTIPVEIFDAIVDKVIFRLHESFENPKRVLRRGTPFEVSDTAYGSFCMNISIYLKGRKEPISHMYELILPYSDHDEKKQTVNFNIGSVNSELRSFLYKAKLEPTRVRPKSQPNKDVTYETLFGEPLQVNRHPKKDSTTTASAETKKTEATPAATSAEAKKTSSSVQPASASQISPKGSNESKRPSATPTASNTNTPAPASSQSKSNSTSQSTSKPSPTGDSGKPSPSADKSSSKEGCCSEAESSSTSVTNDSVKNGLSPLSLESAKRKKTKKASKEKEKLRIEDAKTSSTAPATSADVKKESTEARDANSSTKSQSSKSESKASTSPSKNRPARAPTKPMPAAQRTSPRPSHRIPRPTEQPDAYLASLFALQERILTLRDRTIAQRIADVLDAAGPATYGFSATTLDFDLSKLDVTVVERLWACFDGLGTRSTRQSAGH